MSNEERKYNGGEVFLLVTDQNKERATKRGSKQFLLGPFKACEENNVRYTELDNCRLLMHLVKQFRNYDALVMVEAIASRLYPDVKRYGVTTEVEQKALVTVIDPH